MCGMRVSDEFNLWKMATYEEETIWKYITVQGWGKGNIYCGNYSQEILRRLAIVIWLEEEDLCRSGILSRWIPSSKRRQNCFPSPAFCFPEIRFCSCQILKGVSFAFSYKRKSLFCLQRFWTRCAKCSRCKLVVAMHRKCYWQECRKGRQCGNWTRCKLGKTTYYKIHYQYNTIKCNIIKYYRDNLGAAASGYFDSRCAIWNIGPGKTSAVNNRSVIWRHNQN